MHLRGRAFPIVAALAADRSKLRLRRTAE